MSEMMLFIAVIGNFFLILTNNRLTQLMDLCSLQLNTFSELVTEKEALLVLLYLRCGQGVIKNTDLYYSETRVKFKSIGNLRLKSKI